MSDKDKAMQQALEALIDAANVLSAPMFADAVDALKVALEQPPLPVQEPVAWLCCVPGQDAILLFDEPSDERYPPKYKDPLYTTPPLPVQEPKKRCCDHDSDCAIHNGDALPVGPCDCSQTFISSPDLGIVVTVSYQLAVRELAKLVENNFGQMPRNDEWADKVLLVRDTFEAAHNIKEK